MNLHFAKSEVEKGLEASTPKWSWPYRICEDWIALQAEVKRLQEKIDCLPIEQLHNAEIEIERLQEELVDQQARWTKGEKAMLEMAEREVKRLRTKTEGGA